MKYKIIENSDVVIFEPTVFEDNRGFFMVSYNKSIMDEAIGENVSFVQSNHSFSKKGVLRGLHYQAEPFSQGKLVRVLSGKVFDVAVDIRPESLNYGNWVGVELSQENKKVMWIPKGYAHGFLSLTDDVHFEYSVTNYYSKEHERTIHWSNNDFRIEWPSLDYKIITSSKDSLVE